PSISPCPTLAPSFSSNGWPCSTKPRKPCPTAPSPSGPNRSRIASRAAFGTAINCTTNPTKPLPRSLMARAEAIPVSLHEPGEPTPQGPGLKAFLELGFRPLYIAGCAWALLSVAIWIYAPQWLTAPLGGVAWHAHEMLWGFVATIAVGFLLTASATWTGHNPLKGLPLAGACVLWLVSRAGYLAGGATAFYIAAVAETAFFLISAVALMRVMLKGKSK